MYKYGMRLRGFSIGCQPMNGLEEWQDTEGKYYSELTYSRKLSTEECEQYELDYIGTVAEKMQKESEEPGDLMDSAKES